MPASTTRPRGTRSACLSRIWAAPPVMTPGRVQPSMGKGRSSAPVATMRRLAKAVATLAVDGRGDLPVGRHVKHSRVGDIVRLTR